MDYNTIILRRKEEPMKKEKIGLVTAVTQLATAIILLIQALKD
nr:MAG TPA: protein of unknown function (UPF0258) [Caudoviricetes sp.]